MSLLERIYKVADHLYGKDGRWHLDTNGVIESIKLMGFTDDTELSDAGIEKIFFKSIPMADYARTHGMSYSLVQKNKDKYLSLKSNYGGYYIDEFELPHNKAEEIKGLDIMKEIQSRQGIYEYLREISSMESKPLSVVIADILEADYANVDGEIDDEEELERRKLKK